MAYSTSIAIVSSKGIEKNFAGGFLTFFSFVSQNLIAFRLVEPTFRDFPTLRIHESIALRLAHDWGVKCLI
jgi:hypothetical protein